MRQNIQFKNQLLSGYQTDLDHSCISGERFASRIAQIAEIGQTDEGGSYRIGFSNEEARAKSLVKQWMKQAELEVSEDGAGNVFGRLEGKNGKRPAILSGSHIDTVPNGGHFDGVIGVLSALEVVEAWRQTGYQPEQSFEVVIFTDEEGSRFNSGFHGSKAMVGDFDPVTDKALIDIYGESLEKVVEYRGWSLNSFAHAKRDLSRLETLIEVHIEQGKRLEQENLPVGIVTGIAGSCWVEITFRGCAGHAGNTPMDSRKDALVCAGEFVYTVKSLPEKASSSAVATVGKLNVHPNGVNVIPDEVKLYVDIRDIHEDTRDELVQRVIDEAEKVAVKHQCSVTYTETLRTTPVPISSDMKNQLAEAVTQNNIRPFYLPSGAGHDAMIVGHRLPTSMLFVQSQNGISHSPEEWSSLNACIQGVHVLKDYLEKLTQS